MTVAVTMKHGDPRLQRGEASRFLAPGTVSVLLDWPLPPDNSEDAVRPEVATLLGRALAACGHVAFWCDEAPGTATLFPPPPDTPGSRLAGRLLSAAGLGGDPPAIAVAPDAAAASALFRYGGWSYAEQAVIVFDPARNPAPVLDALRNGLDWRRSSLPPGARLLFGPGHDGAFAVLSATSPEWLDRFRSALAA